MPRDTQGNYSLPNGYRAVTGQKVLASQHNPPLEDLASNMTGSVARNGTSPMLADMPMGGHKITDMADGVANNDGATVGQVPAAVASVSPSLVAKDVPDDADLLVISDSADSNKPKKLSWEKLRTALQRIVSSAAGTLFTLESTATSVNSGPNIDLYRNSASPGVDNALAALLFNGQDSAGNKELYAAIRSILKSPTDGSEAAELILRTIVSGALADRLHIGAGAYMDGATGGDPGIGKFNAQDILINGRSLAPSYDGEIAAEWAWSTNIPFVPLTNLGAYQKLTVIAQDLSFASTSNVALQVSTNNGATWITSGYSTNMTWDTSGVSPTDSIPLVDQTGGGMGGFVVEVNMFNHPTMRSAFYSIVSRDKTTGRAPVGANNALRVRTYNGVNITDGRIIVLGWRNR